MSAEEDLAVLQQQESLLRFTEFGPEAAWELGGLLRTALLDQKAGGTVEIELYGQILFACTTPGAKANQADWIRRKRNTVDHLHRSSYAIGRELERDAATLESAHNLSEADFAAHGGGFPLWLKSNGASHTSSDELAGSITLSGLPQREDHNVVVAAIAAYLNIAAPHLA